MKSKNLQAYTLLEMAIVITIIGLITGGVMYGKTLLAASRLQTVMTDVDNYTTAVVNFKQTYQSLPGDFTNATSVWGTDNVGCPAGGGTTGTCNGNGSGMLQNTNAIGQANETFLFWQHLNKAGMMAQSLSNQSGSGDVYNSVIGTNVPAGSLKGSGFSVMWWGMIGGGDTDRFQSGVNTTTNYGNVIVFGATNLSPSSDWSYLTGSPMLPADQAQQVDSKMDDGNPGTGKVLTYMKKSTITPSCATTNNAATAAYNVITSSTVPLCSLIFVMGF